MNLRQVFGGAAALLAMASAMASAQSVRGRVFDATQQPVVGALVELQDSLGHRLHQTVTSASGAFLFILPQPGSYRFRVAAIGYEPAPVTAIAVAATGVTLPDVVLKIRVQQVADLVAGASGKRCGPSLIGGDIFASLLENAQTTLQVVQAAIDEDKVGFEVVQIGSRAMHIRASLVAGTPADESVTADTTVRPLLAWPVQSIDPDTLKVVGFGRTLVPKDERTRQFYGPDARVLFSDWFLNSHCFVLVPPGKGKSSDTLRLRFTPARTSRLVDVSGELVFEVHTLALVRFEFKLQNLPAWMENSAAGGELRFQRLSSGLWIVSSWDFTVPLTFQSTFNGGYGVGGQVDVKGRIQRVFAGADTLVVGGRPPR